MSALILIAVIVGVLFVGAGLYSVFLDPEVIDKEEVKNIQKRHGVRSRAFVHDYYAKREPASYYTKPYG